jgi:hypothetical protein
MSSKSTRSGFDFGLLPTQTDKNTMIGATKTAHQDVSGNKDDTLSVHDVKTSDEHLGQDNSFHHDSSNHSTEPTLDADAHKDILHDTMVSTSELVDTPKKMNVLQPKEVPSFLTQCDGTVESNTTLGTNNIIETPENVAWMST